MEEGEEGCGGGIGGDGKGEGGEGGKDSWKTTLALTQERKKGRERTDGHRTLAGRQRCQDA